MAIADVAGSCGRQGRRWVAETDIANCFSAIPQDKLMQAVEERISDQGVHHSRAMLRAGVMEDGQVRREVTGTRKVARHHRCSATFTSTGWTGHGMRTSMGCWCATAMTWW